MTSPWPLYPLAPGEVYVNFGFWGMVPAPRRAARTGTTTGWWRTRWPCSAGIKGCTRRPSIPRSQFWASYNGPAYAALKERYDGGGRVAGLYEKCVRGQ